MNSEIAEYLKCSSCQGTNLHISGNHAVCKGCSKKYPIEKGKVFFVDPPKVWPESSNPTPTLHSSWSRLRRSEFKFTSRILNPLSADSVVYDLGAGESHFSELFTRFKRVIPVDIFPYPKVIVVADFTKEVPLQDNSGDVLVLSNVLEHIAEPDLFLKEGNRVLKSGGTIVGTIPFMLGVHQAPYDYNRFTDYMLKHLLAKAGFIDVEIQTLSTPYNTYTSMTGNFFKVVGTYLAMEGTRFDRLKFRLVRKLHSVMMNRFRSLFASIPPASEFALGYGFTARKK